MNRRSLYCIKTLKRFYYILTEKEIDDNKVSLLINKYYTPHKLDLLEHIIEMYFYLVEIFIDDSYKENISYLYLNSMLVDCDCLPIRFIYKQFVEFKQAKLEYLKGENKTIIYDTILSFIINEKRQSKKYYQSLRKINFKEIVTEIAKDKELLNKVYKVKSIALYSLFLYDDRIDSDIDLLVEFNEDVRFKEKTINKIQLENYLFYKFDRYIDILELKNNINERLVEITKDSKVII